MVPGNSPSQLEILSTGQTYYETDLLQSSWHLDESEGINDHPKAWVQFVGHQQARYPVGVMTSQDTCNRSQKTFDVWASLKSDTGISCNITKQSGSKL